MNINFIKLEEVAIISAGGTPSRSKNSYWKNGDIPWIKISDIKSKHVRSSEEMITSEGLNNSSAKLFKKNTILYTIFATLGEVAILDIDATTNQAIAGIVVDESKININYMYYYFKSIKQEIINKGRGVAQNNINLSILRNLIIPLPSLEEQNKIAAVLDAAQSLIEKRKEAIEKLDELVQSVFLDMFGDPVQNEKQWETNPFDNYLDQIESGWSPKCESFPAREDSWGVLKLSAISQGKFIFQENKELPPSLEPKETIEVKKGDLLFSRKNTMDLVGTCAYVFDSPKYLMIPDTIFRFVLKDANTLNKIFLWQLFNNEKFKKEVQKLAGGSAGSMPNISKQNVKKISIIVPDIELQNKYENIVTKIVLEKDKMNQSLNKLEYNFRSILNKAFKGELVIKDEIPM